MKTIRFVLLATILQLMNAGFTKCQTPNNSTIPAFGLGLHVEQFKLSDNDLNNSPANKIIFTINPTKSFRLEPEFGFRFGKNQTDNLKNGSIYLGVGAFGMFQRSKLNIYYGLRFEYAFIQSSNSSYSTASETTDRYLVVPAIGCEYYVGENFSLGGEIGLKYASLKSTDDLALASSSTTKNYYFTTDTGLFIRFYF